MKRMIGGLICAAIFFCSNAYATDWRGPYVGASFGITDFSSGASLYDEYTASGGYVVTETGQSKQDGTSASLGLLAGYNYQTGPVVLGGQVEGGVSTLDTDMSAMLTVDDSDSGRWFHIQNIGRIRSDWSVSLIGRAGVSVGPRVLVYALGGATYANFQVSGLYNPFFHDGHESYQEWAPVYGGGIELKATDSFSLRAEYRNVDFDDKKLVFFQSTPEFGGYDRQERTFDLDTQSVLISAVFNFH